MSNNFQFVDLENLDFVSLTERLHRIVPADPHHALQPNYMYIDYVRVYQRTDMINIGCDPDDYPTAE